MRRGEVEKRRGERAKMRKCEDENGEGARSIISVLCDNLPMCQFKKGKDVSNQKYISLIVNSLISKILTCPEGCMFVKA